MTKVLARFSMSGAKLVGTPLAAHSKLSKDHAPAIDKERNHMSKVPYVFAIGILMYAMMCTRPDIANEVGVVSQ